MRTIEEEIYNFILPYLSDTGKPIETITEYKRYNMELIESHRHLILDFINRFFNIRKGLIAWMNYYVIKSFIYGRA